MERYLKVEPRPPKPELPHSRQHLGAPGLERTRLVTKALEKLINREKGKKATPSRSSTPISETLRLSNTNARSAAAKARRPLRFAGLQIRPMFYSST